MIYWHTEPYIIRINEKPYWVLNDDPVESIGRSSVLVWYLRGTQ